jgi:uncharacterized delta-60 repeat protein
MIKPLLRNCNDRGGSAVRSGLRPATVDALESRVLLALVAADPSFGGGDGIATAVFAGMGGLARAVAVQPDGKVIAAGGVTTNGNPDDTDLAIARFNADGSLDRTFGGTGMVIDPRMDVATAVVLRPGGKVFVSGVQVNSGAPNPSDLAMLRYNADGTPDASFGDHGLATVDFRGYDGAAKPTFLPDGKILFVGAIRPNGTGDITLLLARLLPDGSLDRTFGGGDGLATPDFGGPEGGASGVVALPDGRFVVAGTAGPFDTGDLVIARFLPDGTPDATFGRGGADGDGRTVIDMGGREFGMGLSPAPDGGYTIVGMSVHPDNQANLSDYALAHVTRDGAVDPGFGGGDGRVTFDGDSEDYVSAVVTLPDGRIAVAGNKSSADHPVGLALFRPDGTLDTSFNGTGIARAGADMPIVPGLAAQPDGKLLVAGGTGRGPSETTFAVTRFGQFDRPPGPNYQAEAARLEGMAVKTNHPGYTGSGFVDYRHGGFVEFEIDAPAAGQYLLDFRYANGSASFRTLQLTVDGVDVLGAQMRFEPTGSWNDWGVAGRAVTLSAGRHAVRLASPGNGPNIDALTLRPLPVPPPPVTVQAESSLRRGPGVASAHAGYTGSGYLDFHRGLDEFVEFRVEVPTAGQYALDFRYANGTRGDRPLDLSVNGTLVRPGLSFAPFGTWTDWRTTTATATLAAGVNLVRLTAAGFGGANIDALTVRPA